MNIGIVVAMEKEFKPIASFLENSDSRVQGHFTYTWGALGSHHVVAIHAGIGKVHAALATTMLVYHARPDCIISIGCSGAIANELDVGDIASACEVAYHDVWCGEGNVYGQVQGCPPRFTCHRELTKKLTDSSLVKKNGLFLTGEFFIPTPDMLHQLHSRFDNPIAVDMESAAVAQTCWIEGYPFAALRVISDTPGTDGSNPADQYQRFWSNAPEEAFGRIMNIVENL